MITPDTRAVLSLLFNEQQDSVRPSDGTGNVGDFADDATTTMPEVVTDTLSGHARQFVSASATAIFAEDTDDALMLTRDVSVVALLALDVDLQAAYGSDGSIIQRGLGTTISWGLRLQVLSAVNRTVKVYMVWNEVSGSAVADTGVEFTWPEGETLLVAAVREVIDGQFVCRYQVNGESVNGGTHSLDVDSASGLKVWVGGHHTGSAYANYLDAVIDAIEVYDEAISAEEFAWLWRRLSKDQPDGAKAIKALVPQGVYSTDEDSSIQRELTVQGVAVGVVRSLARRLSEYFWPSKAWGSILERWENITQHSPKPGDSLAVRRNRVTSFLGTVRGFAVTDIKAVLEETFDLDSADIEILEYDNDYSQDFAADPADYILEEGNGSTVIGGAFGFGFSAVAMDFASGPDAGKAGWALWTVAGEQDAWIACSVMNASSSSGTVGGLMVGSRALNEWLLFGLDSDGGVFYAIYKGGVLGAWEVLAAAPGVTPSPNLKHLRVSCLGDGEFDVRWEDTAAGADAATPTTITDGPSSIEWAGFVCTAFTDAAKNASCDFDDLLIHAPSGGQRYNWYAYRDPVLAGNPDMNGANLVVQRVKPAHTHGAAITQQSVLCDDTISGCDREPIGL